MKRISYFDIIDGYENGDNSFLHGKSLYLCEEVEALIKFVEEKLLPNVLDNKELKKEWDGMKCTHQD